MTAPTTITIETRLPDDQLVQLADLLAARLTPAAAPAKPAYYTAEEAATLLKTTAQTISSLTKSGKLAKVMLGSREYRISQAAIDAYAAAQAGAA